MKKEGAFIYQGEFSLEGEWPTLYEETHKDHLKSSVATGEEPRRLVANICPSASGGLERGGR